MRCNIAVRNPPALQLRRSDASCAFTKQMGLVVDIFTEEVLAKLPGTQAIGHTRYSTTGDSAILNAQPIIASIAIRARWLWPTMATWLTPGNCARKLEHEGSIFQTSSDTEVIVHLIAHSKEQTLPDAMADALRRVEGAFSLVIINRDRIFAVRDPRGFRPLAMGRFVASTG